MLRERKAWGPGTREGLLKRDFTNADNLSRCLRGETISDHRQTHTMAMPDYLHMLLPAFIHTYTQTYIHTSQLKPRPHIMVLDTYAHSYIHTYIHTKPRPHFMALENEFGGSLYLFITLSKCDHNKINIFSLLFMITLSL